MRSCSVFGVLILQFLTVFADVSELANNSNVVKRIVQEYQVQASQNQNNYNVPLPDIDLRPPEPQAPQFFNNQNVIETNQLQQAATAQQIRSYQPPKYFPAIATQQYQPNPNLSYLPPHQQQLLELKPSVERQYLPPQHNRNFEGPKYLPPPPPIYQQQQVEVKSSVERQYLPPPSKGNYEAPKYLPPPPPPPQPKGKYEAPQYLPPPPQPKQKYEAPKYLPPLPPPSYKSFNTGPSQSHYQAPTYLPPPPEPRNSVYQMSLELPEGYDFVKPEGAEAAIAELHTLPADDASAAAPAYQPDYNTIQSGKIRTVQIVNESAVKTWQILETDESGVRTIKILGASSENPTGEHRVIKVQLPGSKPQTVRVFNDHKIVSNVNQYLPPAVVSRTTHKRSIRVSDEGFYTKVQQ